MKNILVTGGAGFIGSNLCDALIERNYNVVCLDNFSTGKMDNISHLIGHPNFKLIGGDIRELTDCKKACKDVNYILHYANYCAKDDTFETLKEVHNMTGTGFLNMVICAKEINATRFIYGINTKRLKTNSAEKAEALYKKAYAQIFNENYDLEMTGIEYPMFSSSEMEKDVNREYNHDVLKNIIGKSLKLIKENSKEQVAV